MSSDTVAPGLEIYGIDVGGRSKYEAKRELQLAWSQPSISLVGQTNTWVASPEAVGFSLDVADTIERAHQVGRSLVSLRSWITSSSRMSIEPIWIYEPEKAEGFLEALSSQVAVPPVNAGVAILSGRAEMTPPVAGQVLDIPATLAFLGQNSGLILAESQIPLVILPVQPAIVDTSSTVAEANDMLSMVVVVQVSDPVQGETAEFSIDPAQWRHWVSLSLDDSGKLIWSIEESQLRSYLSERSDSFGPGRHLDIHETSESIVQAIQDGTKIAHIRLYHDEREHIVQLGETLSSIGQIYGMPYPWIQQANPGHSAGLYAGQTVTIPSPDVLLPLPVIPDKRIVVSISQQKAWVYEQGDVLWEWVVSTGINDSPTSPGVFQIQSHEPNAYANNWDLWMPNFLGVYRPSPSVDFMNGFHGFPTRNGHNLLWTGDLGRKVTYGCILLSSENAAALYNWAEEGVVVEIRL